MKGLRSYYDLIIVYYGDDDDLNDWYDCDGYGSY